MQSLKSIDSNRSMGVISLHFLSLGISLPSHKSLYLEHPVQIQTDAPHMRTRTRAQKIMYIHVSKICRLYSGDTSSYIGATLYVCVNIDSRNTRTLSSRIPHRAMEKSKTESDHRLTIIRT